jgi:hypothetical protein
VLTASQEAAEAILREAADAPDRNVVYAGPENEN